MDMRWKHFGAKWALGAATVLAVGAQAPAKDNSDDGAATNASQSNESKASARNQQNQQASKDQSNRNADDDADAKHHAVLGVSLAENDGRLRVIAVLPGSPAAGAGIRNGDEITTADGERVRTAQQLVDEIGDKQPGSKVELGIRRDGERQTVQARLVSADALRRSSGNNGNANGRWNDNRTVDNANRSNRPGWDANRGRAASYDESAGNNGNNNDERNRLASQVRSLQQRVARLEQQLAGRSGDRQRRADQQQGNGDNSWYYQEADPNDANQGIHDYGARARDGQ
jgi:hypothetical protein